MTGPEHYREAERLLANLDLCPREAEAKVIAEAQVHATLALTAATAHEQIRSTRVGPVDWSEAIGRRLPEEA